MTDRALRDLESIYEFIGAGVSVTAFDWFNEFTEAIYSLEKFPDRGTVVKEETPPIAFWKESQHVQNYLCGG